MNLVNRIILLSNLCLIKLNFTIHIGLLVSFILHSLILNDTEDNILKYTKSTLRIISKLKAFYRKYI